MKIRYSDEVIADEYAISGASSKTVGVRFSISVQYAISANKFQFSMSHMDF